MAQLCIPQLNSLLQVSPHVGISSLQGLVDSEKIIKISHSLKIFNYFNLRNIQILDLPHGHVLIRLFGHSPHLPSWHTISQR
jgi:hypothetical protein